MDVEGYEQRDVKSIDSLKEEKSLPESTEVEVAQFGKDTLVVRTSCVRCTWQSQVPTKVYSMCSQAERSAEKQVRVHRALRGFGRLHPRMRIFDLNVLIDNVVGA
jgi:hypothetical protein